MKTTTTLLVGLALATMALAIPTASADADIRTPFGDLDDVCNQDLYDCGLLDRAPGGSNEDTCNGLYDPDGCTCRDPTIACGPGAYCQQYVIGLCVVGYAVEHHFPTE